MKRSLGSCSSPVRSTKRLREKRTPQFLRHEHLRQLLPAVIADIIESYAARPHVGAFNLSRHSFQIFTGDWASPPKLILLERRLRQLIWVGDVCEFLGALVVIASEGRAYETIVVDTNGNLQERTISSRSPDTLVQMQGKLYTFRSSQFAVFDHHAKCFLPDINLPPGYSGVKNVCVFKGRFFLRLFKNGPRLHLSSFDSDISTWRDEGAFPAAVCVSQMCANDKIIFFYGLGPCKSSSCFHYLKDAYGTCSEPCGWGVLLTWTHDTGFTPPERVAGELRLITCDSEYIYFINSANVVVLYDISTKQLTPDPAPIAHAWRMMRWFNVSSWKIF